MSIKCPECGKKVNEVYTVCPWCGCPLGGNDGASSAAENFNLGIQKINNEKTIELSKKEDEFSERIANTKNDKKRETLKEQRDEQLERIEERYDDKLEKFISSFPVPSTTNDLVQFMSIVSSNVKTGTMSVTDEMNEVWFEKMEQIKSQADISMTHDEAYSKLLDIYNKKVDAYEAGKKRSNIVAIVMIIVGFLALIWLFNQ